MNARKYGIDLIKMDNNCSNQLEARLPSCFCPTNFPSAAKIVFAPYFNHLNRAAIQELISRQKKMPRLNQELLASM